MIKRLLKIWAGIFCVSLLGNWGILWVQIQNMDPVANGNPHQAVWGGILLTWNTLSIVYLSIGAAPLLLNTWGKIRNNKWSRSLSFFLVPVFMIAIEMIPRILEGHNVLVSYPVFLPFMLCLTASYVFFSRKLKKE